MTSIYKYYIIDKNDNPYVQPEIYNVKEQENLFNTIVNHVMGHLQEEGRGFNTVDHEGLIELNDDFTGIIPDSTIIIGNKNYIVKYEKFNEENTIDVNEDPTNPNQGGYRNYTGMQKKSRKSKKTRRQKKSRKSKKTRKPKKA